MPPQPRPYLLGLPKATHGGLDHAELHALGIDPETILDFSVNTNPFGPSPAVLEAFRTANVSRYPDSEATLLKQALADQHHVTPDRVLIGNGSVELMWLVAYAYLAEGTYALTLAPTFGEYRHVARVAGAEVTEITAVAEQGFRLEVPIIAQAVGAQRPAVVFICNPNNPTGVLIPPMEIATLSIDHPDTLFVIDEAYVPFINPHYPRSSDAGSSSCLDIDQPANLLVLRSMTKDCGIPGLRLGYAVGDPEVIGALRTVQPPWSVNAPAQAAGLAALRDRAHVERSLCAVAEAQDYLTRALMELGLEVLPSRSNMLLLRIGDAAAFRLTLLRAGYCVRDCASFGLPDYVRIGPRTLPECRQLVTAIQRVVNGA